MCRWLERFLSQNIGLGGMNPTALAPALRKIVTLGPDGSDGLLLDVIQALLSGHNVYDRFKLQRKQNRDIVAKEFPTVQQAIVVLRSFLGQHPDAGSLMLGGAYLHWKGRHQPKKVQFHGIQDSRVSFAELQEEFLALGKKF
jgi:hypothetical protein